MVSENDTTPNAADNGGQNSDENNRSPNHNTPVAADAAPISDRECCKTKNAKTNWTEIFAFVAAIGGILAAIFSGWQAWVASEQSRIANKSLLASQRPWISGDSFSLGSDLVFDQRGGQVTIAYILKNVGNIVATHVESGVQLIPYQLMAAIDDATNQAGIMIETDLQPSEVCKPQAEQSDRLWNEERQWGSTLFPNNTIPKNESTEMAPEEIAKFNKDKIGFFGLLIACITYRSPFDDHAHQTGYSFFLLNRGEGHALLDPQMGKISKANLKLTPFWNATGFAN